MQIEGYTPPDAEIQTKVGIKLIYTVKLDSTSETFEFHVLSAGRANTALKIAADKKANVRALSKQTGVSDGDEGSDIATVRDAVELLHDHVVLSWSTTLKLKGQKNPIKPTRDNFIALLTMEKFEGVFVKLTADTTDLSKFTKEVEEEDAKK